MLSYSHNAQGHGGHSELKAKKTERKSWDFHQQGTLNGADLTISRLLNDDLAANLIKFNFSKGMTQ